MSDILSMSEAVESDAGSALNPNAKAFVPSWQAPATQPSPASSNGAQQQLDVPQHWFMTHGYGYAQPHGYSESFAEDDGNYFAPDAAVAHALDMEDAMRQTLHQPPQQPKGNTYGRARGHQGQGWR